MGFNSGFKGLIQELLSSHTGSSILTSSFCSMSLLRRYSTGLFYKGMNKSKKLNYTFFLNCVKSMKYRCLVCYSETVTIFTYSMRCVKEAIPPKTFKNRGHDMYKKYLDNRLNYERRSKLQ